MTGLCWIITTCTLYLPHVVSPPSWLHPHHWQPHGGGEGGGAPLGWAKSRAWREVIWEAKGDPKPLPESTSANGGCGAQLYETPSYPLLENSGWSTTEGAATWAGRWGHYQICQRYGCKSCDVFDIDSSSWWSTVVLDFNIKLIRSFDHHNNDAEH